MEIISRYFGIKALKIKDNILIPFWLLKHTIVNEYDCEYDKFIYEGEKYDSARFIDAIWDSKKQRLVESIVVESTPIETDYKINEKVLVEVPYSVNNIHNQKRIDIIKDIKFKYDYSNFFKGKDLLKEKWIFNENKTSFLINDIKPELMYEVRQFVPVYILENGEEIEYNYQLNHLLEN